MDGYRDTDDKMTLSCMYGAMHGKTIKPRTRKQLKRYMNSLYGKRYMKPRRINPFQAILTRLTMAGWRTLSSGNRRQRKNAAVMKSLGLSYEKED